MGKGKRERSRGRKAERPSSFASGDAWRRPADRKYYYSKRDHEEKLHGLLLKIIQVDPKGFEPSVSALRTQRFPS